MKLIVDTSNLKEIIKFATSLSGIMANDQPSKTIIDQSVWNEFDLNIPKTPELSSANTNIFFKYVELGEMQISISVKLEKTESIIDPDNSLGALNSVISVLSSAFKISDTPLNYNDIIMKNQFKSMGEFIGMIVSSYTM